MLVAKARGKLHSVYNTTHSTAISPAASAKYDTARVNLGDQFITLRHWRGNGPALVLVHGISSSGFSWEGIIPGLAAHFSPITIDLRGHGDSSKPASGYLYDDYVSDLEHVLDALGLDRPLIMGHSLGGIVALWWAAKHPDKAAGLVIVDSPLRSGEIFRPSFDRWIAENAMSTEDLATAYRAHNPIWTEEQAIRRARIMTSTATGVFSELKADSLAHDGVDRIAELTNITSPMLFVHGDPEAGSQVHPADLASLEKRLPNVTMARIEGAGHNLHRERMDEFLDLAVPFLEECVRNARLS
jgi:pimeloyl-ACP methyl ester carboxylesterase